MLWLGVPWWAWAAGGVATVGLVAVAKRAGEPPLDARLPNRLMVDQHRASAHTLRPQGTPILTMAVGQDHAIAIPVEPSPADYATMVFFAVAGGFWDAANEVGTPGEAAGHYEMYWNAANKSIVDNGDPLEVMGYARTAVSWGLQGWNTKAERAVAERFVDQIVDFWTVQALNGLSAADQWNVIFAWVDEMIDEPKCTYNDGDDEYEYQGFTMAEIYARNGGAGCVARERAYRETLWGAIDAWADAYGLPTYSEWEQARVDSIYTPFTRNRAWVEDTYYDYIGAPRGGVLASFAPSMNAALKAVGRDKIINWPGGPPAEVDTAASLGLLAKFLIAMVASVAGGYVGAGAGGAALAASLGATVAGIAELAAEAAITSGSDPVATHKFMKGLAKVTGLVGDWIESTAAAELG